jgi:uncharacterized protein
MHRVDIRNNTEARAYEAVLDGQVVGVIVYEKSQGRPVLTHTAVLPEHRGKGIGRALLRGTLTALIADGVPAKNYCDVVADYVAAHPEYAGAIERPVS